MKKMDKIPAIAKRIMNCEEIKKFLKNEETPCSKILAAQSKDREDEKLRFRPEPWMQDLKKALVLFVGINPTINEREVFPERISTIENNFKYLIERWNNYLQYRDKTLNKPFRNSTSLKFETIEGIWQSSTYWGELRKKALILFPYLNLNQIIENQLVALVDLVHCKSQSKEGVSESVHMCIQKYFLKIMELSPAKVIIAHGQDIPIWLSNIYPEMKIDVNKRYQEIQIAGKKRYVLFLSPPNSAKSRSFEACIRDEILSPCSLWNLQQILANEVKSCSFFT